MTGRGRPVSGTRKGNKMTAFESTIASALSLRTSVDVELANRVGALPEVLYLHQRGEATLDEVSRIADLVAAQRLLSRVNRESSISLAESATGFARIALSRCQVQR